MRRYKLILLLGSWSIICVCICVCVYLFAFALTYFFVFEITFGVFLESFLCNKASLYADRYMVFAGSYALLAFILSYSFFQDLFLAFPYKALFYAGRYLVVGDNCYWNGERGASAFWSSPNESSIHYTSRKPSTGMGISFGSMISQRSCIMTFYFCISSIYHDYVIYLV